MRSSFHRTNSLFFNIYYFDQTYGTQLDRPNEKSGVHEAEMHHIVNFYFTTVCHLLVHNKYRDHDIKFVRIFEETLIKFLPAKDEFLQLFKFSWNFR